MQNHSVQALALEIYPARLASVVTSIPANEGHRKAGQRNLTPATTGQQVNAPVVDALFVTGLSWCPARADAHAAPLHQ
jgi:hypothetical protein